MTLARCTAATLLPASGKDQRTAPDDRRQASREDIRTYKDVPPDDKKSLGVVGVAGRD